MATQAESKEGPAKQVKEFIDDNIDKEKLKEKLDFSNFDANAILRGAQLTLVGAHRALQNPGIFTSDHYRQAAIAVAAGLGIRLLVGLPGLFIRIGLWILSFFISLESVQWDDAIINGLEFIEEYVLQIPFFLMSLMRYIVPTLDDLFMQSIEWVDLTYVKKHEREDPTRLRELYSPNLKLYHKGSGKGGGNRDSRSSSSISKKPVFQFLQRFARKGAISLVIFALSYTPVAGRFVLPAVSFYTFNKTVGTAPAVIIFGSGIFLPRRYLIIFLQTYFSSRSLMRELLEPYFSRIRFTNTQKRHWFRSREGVLFGFGLGFYILVNVPLVGVLIYGIAEASTAYLVTKITDPPPPPDEVEEYTSNQQVWKNKHEFLSLSLWHLDHPHYKMDMKEGVKE